MATTFTDHVAYGGKLQYSLYAINENFVLAFPTGVFEGAPAWIFSTWTTSGDGIPKKPYDEIRSTVNFNSGLSFTLEGPSYYRFDCAFTNSTQDVLGVTMRDPTAGVVATMTLTRL